MCTTDSEILRIMTNNTISLHRVEVEKSITCFHFLIDNVI